MTRLTLQYHLRGIKEGTTEPQCVRQEIQPDSVLSGWRKVKRYYTDPSTEGFDEYESRAKASSYTTGFTQDSGEFCDCFDVRAGKALSADDTVVYLNNIANDPTVRYQRRYDAAQLLDYHIWPDSPSTSVRGLPAERSDIDVSEWLDAGMTGRTIGPTCMPLECANDRCTEGECLADPDVLRDTGQAECMVCGTKQTIPTY